MADPQHDEDHRALSDELANRSCDITWIRHAVQTLEREKQRSGEPPLLRLGIGADLGVEIYVKDESSHPSGSLKHRLARALYLHAICSGWIGPDTTIVEASSGSTAVSEAWFARLLGLRFVAVMPAGTAPAKIGAIEALGGECVLVAAASDAPSVATKIARHGGHYMDQFHYAERATPWTGPDNIASAVIDQMNLEDSPHPHWFVVGAGTGGTATTIGRVIRHRGLDSRVCVVDPPGSRLLEQWSGSPVDDPAAATVIEGIGRPRFEDSFVTTVVDAMVRVPDGASLAGMTMLNTLLARRCGGSSGTNLVGALLVAQQMGTSGCTGSIATILCDSGDRYLDTLYSAEWLALRKLDAEHDRWLHLLGAGHIADELTLRRERRRYP
jgi:cysteine synthase